MDIYCLLSHARSYLRKLDDFFVQAAAIHNATFEHYQVLLAVKSLGNRSISARLLAEHLIRDRAATIQLCWRMQHLGLLDLEYETNSAKPQLLISVNIHGEYVLNSIVQEGFKKKLSYLQDLSPEKREILVNAVRVSWMEGLEPNRGGYSSR